MPGVTETWWCVSHVRTPGCGISDSVLIESRAVLARDKSRQAHDWVYSHGEHCNRVMIEHTGAVVSAQENVMKRNHVRRVEHNLVYAWGRLGRGRVRERADVCAAGAGGQAGVASRDLCEIQCRQSGCGVRLARMSGLEAPGRQRSTAPRLRAGGALV